MRWALDALPRRNRLSDAERAELDEAFLARVEALGADPDLFVAPGLHLSPWAKAAPLGSSPAA